MVDLSGSFAIWTWEVEIVEYVVVSSGEALESPFDQLFSEPTFDGR